MRLHILLVALLVVLAGCGASGGGPAGEEASATPSASDGVATAPSATGSSASSSRVNPWGHEVVTVAIQAHGSTSTADRHRPAIAEALDYWNSNESVAFPVTYSLVSDTQAADVVVHVRPTIETCGDEVAVNTYQYCSKEMENGTTVAEQLDITIAGRYTEDGTIEVAKAAFAGLSGVQYPELGSVPLEDPWPETETVTVGIENTVSDRDFTPVVQQTLSYWESNDETFGNYTTDFELRPNATNPDVTIRIVESIPRCGIEDEGDGETLGCAPVLNRRTTASDPEVIEIVGGQTDESSVRILKHEFGHLFGRHHGQQPMPLMNESYDSVTLPQPDAVDREYPWTNTTLSVYVDTSTVPDLRRDDIREEVNEATTYYGAGADGTVPEEVEFVFTENASEADIVIQFPNSLDDGDDGSVGTWYGYDPDEDEQLEYYTSGTVRVADVDTDHIGWHVGYWFGMMMGAESESDLPPPFDEPESDDREHW